MCSHHAVFFHIGAQYHYTHLPGVFGERVWPGTLECIGLEASLLECESNVGSVNAYCSYNDYLSVQCASEFFKTYGNNNNCLQVYNTKSSTMYQKISQSTAANFSKRFFPSENLTFASNF